MNDGPVLFAARSDHALQALMPVVERLEARGRVCRILRTDPTAGGSRDPAGRRVEAFAVPAGDRRLAAARIAGRLSGRLGRLLAAAATARRCRRFIARVDPSAAVFTDDHILPEASLVRAANRLGRPTLLVQWAFTLPQPLYDRMRGRPSPPAAKRRPPLSDRVLGRVGDRLGVPQRLAPCFGGGEASRIAVSGPAFVEQFADQGVAPGKMTVTGNPQHDAVVRFRSTAPAPGNTAGAARRPPLFVYGTQPLAHFGILSAERVRQQARRLVEAVGSIDGARLHVTLHPRDEPSAYAFLSAFAPRVTVSKGSALTPLVAAADVYISQYSSTILTAMMLDRPVVVLHWDGLAGAGHFADGGGTLAATDAAALPAVLRTALADENADRRRREQRRVLARYAIDDGRAAQRIADLVEGLRPGRRR